MTATSTASKKSKGRTFQQYVARELQTVTGLPDVDICSRGMGGQGIDIMLSACARQKIPFAIECKRAESWAVSSWWMQTVANAETERMQPALIFKENRRRPYAMIYDADFGYMHAVDDTQKITWHDTQKSAISWRVKSWISEAERAAGATRSPKLTIIRPGDPAVCIIPFIDFCHLVKQWGVWNASQLEELRGLV